MNIFESALSLVGIKVKKKKEIKEYNFDKCCGGGCHEKTTIHVIKIDEKTEQEVEPVEYDDVSKVRFSREDKKFGRLREYFKLSKTEEDNKINDL